MVAYNLADRVVAITGSTGGLGSALAAALVAKGARLALLDLDGSAASTQAASLGNAETACGWTADVRSFGSVQGAFDSAAEHFGGIDVVIANAGIESVGSLSTLDPELFDAVIDINLNGVWRTFKAALPHVQARQGYLLATSSMAAFVHSPLQSPYTASKAGVWAMSDSVRLELRSLGVGVGTLHPTFFQTPMMEHVHADPAGLKLWGGNTSGIWKMVPLPAVVDAAVNGIERRSDVIVVPGRNALVAKAPGLFRKIIERIGFNDRDITEAINLARRTA
ncbi:SDR family NAD(P)-dependent oxidoreductase [Mycobacterium colombiense]|uniref:Short-chain dehydrogenase n=1 Tax=Mycobacterium colombiense TaxID=339268 RepID=A0A1A2YS05_9MYCO|nr:SDR family NAD(P)-dependent oxidoreductase [Mycobacterium colombiense]OBI39701.1 short-chain dehydrogenase [Mycobacterium colombiense]